MSSKWWNNFLKYAFFAPIYVFFIYLGLQIVTNLGIKTLTIEAPESFKYSMVYLTNYLFALIIFAGAPIVAMSMGIYSSSAIIKTAKGALGKAARAPIRGAWRKFDRQVLAPRGLSPKAIKTAWEMRREEKEEKAFRPAIGGWRDMFNKYLPFSKREKTFYGEQESDLLIDKERTKLVKQSLSKDGLADIANASKKSGDMPRFQAALLELVSRGDEEGLFQHKELGAEYGYITSTENMAQLIQDSIKDKEEAIRFAGKVGASAKLSGIPQYDGMTEYNLKKKEMAWTPVSQMGAQGGYEAMKVYAQRRWRTFNRRAYLSMDKDGKPVEVTNAFKVMLRTIDTSDIDRATKEMSGLNKRYVAIDGKDKVQAEINRITDTTQKKIAQDWLNGIEESLTAEKTSTSKPPTSPTSEPRISTGTSEEEFKKAREKHKPGEFG